MVVICGGTTGYNASLDLRPFWYFQKRFQGSHGASPEEARETTKLMRERKIRPTLTKTYKWEDLSYAHQLMTENKHPLGNTAVLVGTEKEGTGADK